MAGLLGFLAAGAAKGAGAGIVAEARARREAAISELEHSRLLQREQADRDFRSKEAATARGFQAEQNELSREESRLDREARREESRAGREEVMTGSDGVTLLRDGDTVRPVKDQDGNPIKSAPSKSNDPADVQTANWLVREGIATDSKEAWTILKRASEKQTTPADVERMVEKAVDTELGGGLVPPSREAIEESRERNRIRIRTNLGLETEEEPSRSTAPVSRPEGASDADIIKQANDALAAGAPANAVKARLESFGIDPSKVGL
ncbi:hypothetical protein DYI37_03940 [Fulvimarina endophytica]|uniref:Uncharacterized protein n=1 Tax=Fulvimarina endophytica TaxID=2293836 RepID=A0A371X736_9HYPH|nr:hypothetical protein [Fulvimarina endophytica]RFC65026.1 hypothetical protein DYI37_03940 [Fulvimarina endophytica]